MVKPIGTVLGVVENVLKAALVTEGAVVVTLVTKYTRLSTTRSMAVWLFITLSLGLDSTFTLPNDSSRETCALRLPKAEVGLA